MTTLHHQAERPVRTDVSARVTYDSTTKRPRLGPARRVPFGRLLGPVLLVAVWSITAGAGWLDQNDFPAPWQVVDKAIELTQQGVLGDNLLVSFRRAMIGLALGVAAGLVLALVSGLSRLGEAVIDGPLQIWRAIPALAVIPLAIIWLGIGEEMKITLIAAATMIPVYINTAADLSGVDVRYAELAETLGLRRSEFIRKIALPNALPGFFTGLRLSATVAWLVLVVVEQTNASSGLGYMMTFARSLSQLDVITVGLAVYAILGLTTDTLVRILERRALRWRKTM